MTSYYHHSPPGEMSRGKQYPQDHFLCSQDEFRVDDFWGQPQSRPSFEIARHYGPRPTEPQPLKIFPPTLGSYDNSPLSPAHIQFHNSYLSPQEQVPSGLYSPRSEIEAYKPLTPGDSSFAMSPAPSESDFMHSFQAGNDSTFTQHSHVNMFDINNSPGVEHLVAEGSSAFDLMPLDGRETFEGSVSVSNQYRVSPDDMDVRYGDSITAATSSYPPLDIDRREASFSGADPSLPSIRDASKINTAKNRKRGPEAKQSKAKPAPKKLRTTPSPVSAPARAPVPPPTLTPPTLTPPTMAPPRPCGTCHETFPDEDTLREHTHSVHPKRLVCVFGYAGCDRAFPNKNEWKRHVMTQHIVPLYWLCTDPACVKASPDGRGGVFNRKDLYTEHVRRMHVPPEFKGLVDKKGSVPRWDAMLQELQKAAVKVRCVLPSYVRCPAEAAGCDLEFRGASAWDDRMEHVAVHLLNAANPAEPRVCFGGDGDPTLTDWAASPEVRIVKREGAGDRWVFAEPLKTTAKEAMTARKAGKAGKARAHDSEEDAEGEPE